MLDKYLEGFTSMQAGRIKKILSKVYRYGGVVMSRAAWVEATLQDGYKTAFVKGVYTGGKKWVEAEYGWGGEWVYTQKDEYQLQKDNYSYTITKTEYDYANYLTEVM